MEAAVRARDLRVARLPWTTDRNPYQAELYSHLRREGIRLVGTGDLDPGWLRANADEVDILHFHWRLDRLLDGGGAAAFASVARRLALARSLGLRIAWTVHEPHLLDPDGPGPERGVAEIVAAHADVVLVHDEAAAVLIRRWFAIRGDVTVTPVGRYVASRTHPGRTDDLRRALALGPNHRVALAFGQHRPDKDLALLFAGFGRVTDPDAVLVVAGAIADPLRRLVHDAQRVDRRVRVVDGEVPEHDVAPLHDLADVAVLARSVDWTSSSLLLAASLGTPIVAADLPTTRAQLGARSAHWFRPGDPTSLGQVLTRSLQDLEASRAVAERATDHVAGHSWHDASRLTGAAFRAVAGSPRSSSSSEHVA